MCHTIIFKDDTGLHLPEKPGNRFTDSFFATQVRFPEKCSHLTIPVDHLDQGLNLLDPYRFFVPAGARAIDREIQLSRL